MSNTNFQNAIRCNRNPLIEPVFQMYGTLPASPVIGLFGMTAAAGPVYWDGIAFIPFDARKLPPASVPISVLATDPLSRANHTGQQPVSTLSDFNASVQAFRLDQFQAPTTSLDLNGQKLLNIGTPTLNGDATSKNYVDTEIQNAVDNAVAGLDQKDSVRLLADSNIVLTGLQNIDGSTTLPGDRVLVVGQTDTTQNGFYVASSGAWQRSADADDNSEVTPGATAFVDEGTTYAHSLWRLATAAPINLGTTGLNFQQFSAAINYTPGDGVLLTGNQIRVRLKANGGLEFDGGEIQLSSNVPRKTAIDIGDGVNTTFTLTHNRGTRDVVAICRENTSPYEFVSPSSFATTDNTVTASFSNPPQAAQYRLIVIG